MFVLYGFIILFIVWAVFGQSIHGNFGENAVANQLKSLSHSKYIVFNDVMIKTNRGSVQIDHIIVSPYGIFVVETKNMRGVITGYENAPEWTKFCRGHSVSFYNPIMQNRGHINALRHKLNLSADKFISIIAFSSRGRLNISKTYVPVVYISQLIGKIKCYRDIKLSPAQANQIARQICQMKLYKQVSNHEHVRDVHRAIANKK